MIQPPKRSVVLSIAVLEDDPRDARVVTRCLEREGHCCEVFGTARAFVEAMRKSEFSMVLVDWQLPDLAGDEVLRWLRRTRGWDLPVIFVTGRDSSEDIVAMLDAGADDYITKPIKLDELVARVGALGRRARMLAETSGVIRADPFVVDLDAHRLLRGGAEVDLTPKEFRLAAMLFANIGRLLPRAKVLENIWGYGPDIITRTVDIHVSRLRKKLGLEAENGWELIAVHQQGYRLDRIRNQN